METTATPKPYRPEDLDNGFVSDELAMRASRRFFANEFLEQKLASEITRAIDDEILSDLFNVLKNEQPI